jgi:DNA polymerase-3 subunit delta
MTEIRCSELADYLRLHTGTGGHPPAMEPPSPVVLLFGEEMLYKAAFATLRDALLAPGRQAMNYEPLDGSQGNVHEAIEKVNTYALLGGGKLVALLDARLFDSKKDHRQLLKSARESFDAQQFDRGASFLLRFMAVADIAFEDTDREGWHEKLQEADGIVDDGRWLDDLVRYCRSAGRGITAAADLPGTLQKAVEKGFPAGNCLIITTDTIDRKTRLYKQIRDIGLVVDCSVPTGQRHADRMSQKGVLTETMNALLSAHRKEMASEAFEALHEKTGFDLRVFTNGLEQLVTYTGDRRRITREDVETVLKRTRRDPIFAFTNAVTDRNLAEAMFTMASLLADGPDALHPEQILVAMLNQLRKLLLVKDFVSGPLGRVWFDGCPYGHFRSAVMPAVEQADGDIRDLLQQWRTSAESPVSGDSGDGPKKKKRKKKTSATDLLMAKNPKNPYPVYQLFLKSEKFTLDEITGAFELLTEADRRIKSGGENKKLILEEVLFHICR